MALDISKQVEPIKTPWGQAWDHNELVIRMDAILRACGIVNAAQRVKMTAHAIFASGWKQNCWHHNAWGVKIGTWKGSWYTMGTLEANPDGSYYSTTAAWRAFSGWCEAVQDYLDRIGPGSWNAGYRDAWQYMQVEGSEADRAFWEALGHGGYYTDKQFGPDDFASLCKRVRQELAAATDADKLGADDWAARATGVVGTPANPSGKGAPVLGFPFLVAVAVAVAVWLAFVLFLRSK